MVFDDEMKSAITQWLIDSMKLKVNTTQEYTGCQDVSGSCYRDVHTLTLTIEDKLITEVYL